MKIQIIGVGVVGGAQAYLTRKLGHEVIGVDNKRATHEYARMVSEVQRDVELTFICTQEARVPGVIDLLVQNKVKGLYIIKSTVPPGTTRELSTKHNIHICHNPEFLIEERAFETISHPASIIIGQCCAEHGDLLKTLYAPLNCPIISTHSTLSETVKLTLNSYLSTLITFWNQIDFISQASGLKTEEVAKLCKFDPRISSYGMSFFGSPFGGKCLPKDLDQLIEHAHRLGTNSLFLEDIREFNGKLSVKTL